MREFELPGPSPGWSPPWTSGLCRQGSDGLSKTWKINAKLFYRVGHILGDGILVEKNTTLLRGVSKISIMRQTGRGRLMPGWNDSGWSYPATVPLVRFVHVVKNVDRRKFWTKKFTATVRNEDRTTVRNCYAIFGGTATKHEDDMRE